MNGMSPLFSEERNKQLKSRLSRDFKCMSISRVLYSGKTGTMVIYLVPTLPPGSSVHKDLHQVSVFRTALLPMPSVGFYFHLAGAWLIPREGGPTLFTRASFASLGKKQRSAVWSLWHYLDPYRTVGVAVVSRYPLLPERSGEFLVMFAVCWLLHRVGEVCEASVRHPTDSLIKQEGCPDFPPAGWGRNQSAGGYPTHAFANNQGQYSENIASALC